MFMSEFRIFRSSFVDIPVNMSLFPCLPTCFDCIHSPDCPNYVLS